MAIEISTCKKYSKCRKIPETSDPFAEALLNHTFSKQHVDELYTYCEMMLHCEIVAFPRVPPNLRLPSREARFYWHLYVAAAKHLCFYQKEVNRAFLVTLARFHDQMDQTKINISDHLLRLKTFDLVNRRNLINRLERLLSKQTALESICLEGLSLTPTEGVRLLLALYNSRKTMKYVYCWRAFNGKDGPSLVNTEYPIESRFYANGKIGICDWFRAIVYFECLTTLSVNYEYIATPTGEFLVNLAKNLGKSWNWLQLLCQGEDVPCKSDSSVHSGCRTIPDAAWKEVHFWAPALKIQYAIFGIPEYDRHKRFFTPNTPVHTFALSTNIDFRFRQACFLDCTIKTLCHWYPKTLVHLYLQVWHNREDLDSLFEKLFLHLPLLQIFEFVGEIRKLKTLCTMCCQIRESKCNVRYVNIQLQNVVHGNVDRDNWKKSIECLIICFKQDFKRKGVQFDVTFYAY